MADAVAFRWIFAEFEVWDLGVGGGGFRGSGGYDHIPLEINSQSRFHRRMRWNGRVKGNYHTTLNPNF